VPLLTVSEAAKELGISRESVYKAIREGRLMSVIVLGKIGIERKTLKAYSPGARQIAAGKKRARTRRKAKGNG
jgi:excisionase family DNA binding protein